MKALVSTLILTLSLTACVGSPRWRTTSGAVWGTTYHITYESEKDLSDSVVAVTGEINSSLSMFSPLSTVSRINSGETDTVDSHFEKVFNVARKIFDASDGAFDPTVAPLVDLWGFGREGRTIDFPDSATVSEVMEKVGLDRAFIADGRVIKGHPQMEFDFSAIAKGYGVEQVAEMLRRNGCSNFMVEIGGEIQIEGHNPNKKAWRIQIDAPMPNTEPGDSALMIVDLTDCAIATSGNYRNFRAVSVDSIVGHTINPKTGYPAPKYLLSVTVIAPGCTEADALATALMASSPDRVNGILSRFPEVKAILVLPSGEIIEKP